MEMNVIRLWCSPGDAGEIALITFAALGMMRVGEGCKVGVYIVCVARTWTASKSILLTIQAISMS